MPLQGGKRSSFLSLASQEGEIRVLPFLGKAPLLFKVLMHLFRLKENKTPFGLGGEKKTKKVSGDICDSAVGLGFSALPRHKEEE